LLPDHDLVICHPDGTPYDPDWTTTVFEGSAIRDCGRISNASKSIQL
jgi:hypothetical protein